MKRLSVLVGLAVMVGVLAIPSSGAGAATGGARQYLVLYKTGVSLESARAAVTAAGGTIVKESAAIRLATVRSTDTAFLSKANASTLFVGAMRNRPIGFAPGVPKVAPHQRVERFGLAGSGPSSIQGGAPGPETFSDKLWGMEMIDATIDGSYAVEPGNPGVLVGIMDTGIDGSHPDLAANFSHALSRNFTTDIPLIDGPCDEEPDNSCEDPPDVDESGHGTHVAGTVAAALNGFGVSGVAPNVTLVNLRAGQDSGFFFLQAPLDGWIHAADNGIDVVNMSFYTDPWLFNCTDNPADSPQAQKEQRVIRTASQRAVNYAHRHDVTLIAAAGNSALNLGNPPYDFTSPDYPPGTNYRRDVDNSCISVPTETDHVMSVSAVGPTTRKSYYSNWGMEQIVVAAPGGDAREFFGTPQYLAAENRILSTYPFDLAVEEGLVNGDTCTSNHFLILTEMVDGQCTVYAFFQGTSMASPHASGVAAVIVSSQGVSDPVHGGLTMSPEDVQQVLEDTAEEHACPNPRRFRYPFDTSGFYTAYCAGSLEFNGFYGHGIVNALAAATA